MAFCSVFIRFTRSKQHYNKFWRNLNQRNFCHINDPDGYPENYYDPTKTLRNNEILELLERAKSIKDLGISHPEIRKCFSGKRVSIFSTNREKSITSYIFLWTAAHSLGAMITPIYLRWNNIEHKPDLGRMLSLFNDIILMEALYCSDVREMALGCSIPIIHGACSMLQPLQGLANLMTIKEHFGSIENLTLTWIGPGGSMLNTYMLLLPKFGMHINFNCSEDSEHKVSPMLYKECEKLCTINNATMKAFTSPEEAVQGVDIIATTKHNRPNQTISLQMLKNAKENWVFLHDMPRGKTEVDDEVFNHKNSLVWKNFENMVYIILAVIQFSLEKSSSSYKKKQFIHSEDHRYLEK